MNSKKLQEKLAKASEKIDHFLAGVDQAFTPERNLEVALGDVFRLMINDARIQTSILFFTLVGGFVNMALEARKQQREFDREQLSYLHEQTRRNLETEAETQARLKTAKDNSAKIRRLKQEIKSHSIQFKQKKDFYDKHYQRLVKKNDDAGGQNMLITKLQNEIDGHLRAIDDRKASIQKITDEIMDERRDLIAKLESIKNALVFNDHQHNKLAYYAAIESNPEQFKIQFNKPKAEEKKTGILRKTAAFAVMASLSSASLLGLTYMAANLFNATQIFSPFLTVGTASIFTTGTIVASALSFGIPILLGLVLTGVYFYSKRDKAETDAIIKQVHHNITRLAAADLYFDALDKKTGLQSTISYQSPIIPMAPSAEMPEPIKRLASRTYESTKKFFATANGFIDGASKMMMGLFVTSFIIMSVFPPATFVVGIVVSVASLIFGVYTLVKQYRKAQERLTDVIKKIEANKNSLVEIHRLDEKNKSRRLELHQKAEQCASKYPTERKAEHYSGGLPVEGLANNGDFWKKLTTVKTSVAKRIGSTVMEFLSKAFTLSYLVRGSLPPQTTQVATSVATVASIVVWGPLKTAEYLFNKNYQRDLAMLDETEARLYAARREDAFLNKALEKVDTQLKQDEEAVNPPVDLQEERSESESEREEFEDNERKSSAADYHATKAVPPPHSSPKLFHEENQPMIEPAANDKDVKEDGEQEGDSVLPQAKN